MESVRAIPHSPASTPISSPTPALPTTPSVHMSKSYQTPKKGRASPFVAPTSTPRMKFTPNSTPRHVPSPAARTPKDVKGLRPVNKLMTKSPSMVVEKVAVIEANVAQPIEDVSRIAPVEDAVVETKAEDTHVVHETETVALMEVDEVKVEVPSPGAVPEVIESKVEDTKPIEKPENFESKIADTKSPEQGEVVTQAMEVDGIAHEKTPTAAPAVPPIRGMSRLPRVALVSATRRLADKVAGSEETDGTSDTKASKDVYSDKPPARSQTAVPRAPRSASAATPTTFTRGFLASNKSDSRLPKHKIAVAPRVGMKRPLPTEENETTSKATAETSQNPRPVKRARTAPTPPQAVPQTSAERKSSGSSSSNNAAESAVSVGTTRSASVVPKGNNVWSRLYVGAQARQERTEERARAARMGEAAELEKMKHFATWRKSA